MSQTLSKRSEIAEKDTWDTSTIYANLEAFEKDYQIVEENLKKIVEFQNKLTQSKETLYDALTLRDKINYTLGHLYTYAHLNHDVDTSEPTNQGIMAKVRTLVAKASAAQSFFEPELLSSDEAIVKEYLKDDKLKVHEFEFELLFRSRPHILSEKEEALLAQSEQLFDAPSNTFAVLNNADLKFPSIKDESGDDIEVTHGRYGVFLESNNRKVRQDAFNAVYETYKKLSNTFASTLSSNVKAHNLKATFRGFNSARHSALFNNTIDESVYDTLIQTVHDHLPLLHDYMGLRKNILGLNELRMYDLYVPMVKSVDLFFTFDEAKEITLKALSVLGDEYVSVLNQAFNERWIDIYENQGKRSGAYSSGTYGTNPFILMNWQGNLDNLYTLVHELGHSVHSYFTRKYQPFTYGNYSIFLAEIASTTNENLLTAYLLDLYKDDKDVKAYLINHFLDGVKGTVFRQTQFAEFEHLIHTLDQQGEPLTAKSLCDHYFELNKKYYGTHLTYDENIAYEWSRIPHFYYDYYVYQYATGFSAAICFSERILNEGQSAIDAYINYLKAGWSDYPLNVLKKAGLDMSDNFATQKTMELFKQRLQELTELLK